MSGQIIDASIIAAPRQRNGEAEKAAIKEGRIPEGWAAKPKKLAQKDRDARWTLKRAGSPPARVQRAVVDWTCGGVCSDAVGASTSPERCA